MTGILVNDPIHPAGINRLEDAGLDVIQGPLEEDALDEALSTIQGMIVRSGTTVAEAMLDDAPHLTVIARAGVGVDNIDLDACKDRDVVVFNTPQASTNAVAELTLAHMLSVARWLPRALPTTRQGKWAKKDCRGIELAERTLGVVGLGRIGAHVVSLAQSLGMDVHAHDPYVDEVQARQRGVEHLHEDPEDLAPIADVLTVHTPITPDTRGLIGEAFFDAASDLVVVNTARGGIIDEAALLDALEDGTVLGAGLDVFEDEPPGDHPLFKHPRVSATPHIGAQTEEAQRKAGTLAADGILSTLDEDPPETRIV